MSPQASIIHKIKALMAKTIESGATPEEALLAMAKAHELLAKYQINLSELDLKEEGTEKRALALDPKMHMRYMALHVARYCDCKVWTQTATKQLHFLGLTTDAQFAEWLITALISFVQKNTMFWSMDQTYVTRNTLEDYALGIITTINARLKEEIARRQQQQATGEQNALVVVKNAMVQQAFNALGLNLRNGSNTVYTRGTSAFAQGQQKGNEVGFNRPITARSGQRAIGGGK